MVSYTGILILVYSIPVFQGYRIIYIFLQSSIITQLLELLKTPPYPNINCLGKGQNSENSHINSYLKSLLDFEKFGHLLFVKVMLPFKNITHISLRDFAAVEYMWCRHSLKLADIVTLSI